MSKTKRNGHHQKYDMAERKKHFFERIKYVCSAVGSPEAFDMIPKGKVGVLHKTRFLPFRIVPARGENIPEEVLKEMRSFFAGLLKYEKVPLTKDGPEITLAEYHAGASPFKLYLQTLKDYEFHSAADLKRALSAFALFTEGDDIANNKILTCISVIGFSSCNLNSRLYWGEWRMDIRMFEPYGFESLVLIHSYVPEKKSFMFDGTPRPAIRLCWAPSIIGKVQFITVEPTALGLSTDKFAAPLDVYVQSHALKRLGERIDCADDDVLHTDLCVSFVDPHIEKQTDGSYFIDFLYDLTKAGYLVADVQDGALVIRTFLFITNGGTPEGKKLQELTGMGRLDREFLAIDKLSTFISSDIRSNKELERLFSESGCECLLTLNDKREHIVTKEVKASSILLLMKYIGAGTKEDFLIPDPIARFRKKFA